MPDWVPISLLGLLVQPILKFAGQDISHWFNPKTKEPKTWVDPDTNTVMPFVPFGTFPTNYSVD